MSKTTTATRSEQVKLEKTVTTWMGGYIGVGDALAKLQALKEKDFSKYVPERFGITYHRAMQLQYAANMAGKCKEAGLPVPHNEAGAYRLYRLMKSPGIGEAATLELWQKVSTENKKPTVAQLNAAVQKQWPSDATDSPAVADPTASDWIGKAVTCLQEASNLLEAHPTTVDLAGIDEILNKIRLLTTPTESLQAAA